MWHFPIALPHDEVAEKNGTPSSHGTVRCVPRSILATASETLCAIR